MADALDAAMSRVLYRAARNTDTAASSFRIPAEADIVAKEREMGRAFPVDVRRLYLRIGEEVWHSAFSEDIRLLPIEEVEWGSDDALFDAVSEQPGSDSNAASSVQVFQFGGFSFGDGVLYCPTHPMLGDKFVMMADHESNERAIVLSDSLAGWINRLCDHDGTDYAYFWGQIDNLSEEARLAFVHQHARLNPHVEWPARWLFKREYPTGHPLGYHHWDWNSRRLRPVGEVPSVSSVYLESPTVEDIRSLLTAPWISHVSLSEVNVGEQVAALAALPNLEYLGLHKVAGVFDASPFAACRVLQKLSVSDTRVIGLDKLAGVETLRQIEVANADYQLFELEEIQTRRPKLYIDVIDEARRAARKRKR